MGVPARILTNFCVGTRGFADARGKRDVAVVVDLIKCLQRGFQLFNAGGETLLTSGASFSCPAGLQVVGIHPACILAMYDAATTC